MSQRAAAPPGLWRPRGGPQRGEATRRRRQGSGLADPPAPLPWPRRRQLGRCEPLLELSGHSHWAWCARYNPAHDQLLASGSTDCSVALWYAPALAKLREAPPLGGAAGARPQAGRCGGGGVGVPRWGCDWRPYTKGRRPCLPPYDSHCGGTQHTNSRPARAPRAAPALPRLPRSRPPRPARRAPPPRPAAGPDGRVALFDEEHEDSVYGLAWSAADPWLLASMSYDGRVVVSAVPKGLKYKILI